MRRLFRFSLDRIGLNLVLLAGAAWSMGAAAALETASLTIKSQSSEYKFEVEIADDAEERAQGLMFRKNLPANAGMLFIYPTVQDVAFWMKNTLIPLDMLFIAADGHILRIEKHATPMSETAIPSGAPVKAVLEVNGGLTDELGVQAGDLVNYPGLNAQ
jgi:uncharacterized membrane protein (UPF0127 family)